MVAPPHYATEQMCAVSTYIADAVKAEPGGADPSTKRVFHFGQPRLPVAVHAASAAPHEVTLVGETLAQSFTREWPERLIGDKADDSDPLDEELRAEGVDLIAPHRANRKKPATQDGRKLRRYKRRWKVERLFSWLQKFRRIATRFDFHDENFLGFAHLGCIKILLRCYL